MAPFHLPDICTPFWFLLCSWLLLLATPVVRPDSTSDSWQQYVRGPSTQIVWPARLASNYTAGNVTNPEGVLQPGGRTILSRAEAAAAPLWPNGTVANASSYHAPNTVDGQVRTYDPSNAIDGNTTTFWNDNTLAEYPDILTITPPAALNLTGITVLSNTDGVPIDFMVETLQGTTWSLAATVTNNSAIQIQVPFNQPAVDVTGVRITITKDQDLTAGEYSRINEVYPAVVPDPPQAPTIVLDFGINVVGFLQISFGGASSNHPGIRLAFSETTTYLTDLSDFTRSDNGDTITPGSDQIAVHDKPYVWTDTHGCMYGDQVCADGLHGFRYVKIYLDALASDAPYTEAYGEVIIDSVSLNWSAFLGTPDTFTGWFECSDAELSQWWYDAAYTNQMVIDTFQVNDTDPRDAASPSLIGKLVILDGAKRDRDPYVGDLAVSAKTLYLTHSVAIAAVNVIADLANHQSPDGWIPPASINNYTLPLFDYPLYWVICSYDLLVYTGDFSYMQQYYSTLQRVLNDWYPSVTNTTVSLLDKDIGNSSSYGDYAFLDRSGIVTYYNALYVLGLQNAASIATFLGGHESDAAEWTQRAATVSKAINKYLWDNSTGAYLDSLSGPVRHAQDGNAFSVLASVSSSSQAASLLAYFESLALPYGNPFYDNDSIGAGFSQRVYAFLSYFEIQARFLAGTVSTALDEIRRLYGWMSINDPTVTFWEGIGSDGSMYEGGYTSAAHGWSTGVLPTLTNFVLGVTPTGPGFQNWTIKPYPGDVTWARGVVPTPKGSLGVYWTTEQSSSEFELQIQIPTGTSGDVRVPVSSESNVVTVDGQQIWNGQAARSSGATLAGGYVTILVGSGNHDIIVTK